MNERMRERIKLVRAMETVARSINDERIFESWLTYGVADGDIEEDTTDEELLYYVKDDNDFSELMWMFLRVMNKAKNSGGLYLDGVCSEKRK